MAAPGTEFVLASRSPFIMKPRMLILAAISLLWGSEWLFDAQLAGVPRFRVLSLRCLVAALVLVPWLRLSRKQSPRLFRSILLGAIVIALPTIFLATRPNISPGLVTLLFALMPLIAVLLESSSGLSHAPLLLGGITGIAFLARGGLSFALSQSLSVMGLLLIVIAIAALLVRSRAWLPTTGLAASVLIQMLTAAVLFGAYSWVREGSTFTLLRPPEILSIAALGVLSSAAAYVGFYWLIRQGSVSQAATVQWLIPLVGMIETSLWIRHLPMWDSALGGILAIVCTWLFLRVRPDGDEPLLLQITVASDHPNASL